MGRRPHAMVTRGHATGARGHAMAARGHAMPPRGRAMVARSRCEGGRADVRWLHAARRRGLARTRYRYVAVTTTCITAPQKALPTWPWHVSSSSKRVAPACRGRRTASVSSWPPSRHASSATLHVEQRRRAVHHDQADVLRVARARRAAPLVNLQAKRGQVGHDLVKTRGSVFPRAALCEALRGFRVSRVAIACAYMCAMMLSPNSEHLISVAPSIRRAKS